jgi:hypothetical protein
VDSPRAIRRRGPCIDGRRMQVREERRSAGAGVRPDVRALALLIFFLLLSNKFSMVYNI